MERIVGGLDNALRAFAAGECVRGPSVREFQAELGVASPSVAAHWLNSLADGGLVERIPTDRTGTAARGYRLTDRGRERITQRDQVHDLASPALG